MVFSVASFFAFDLGSFLEGFLLLFAILDPIGTVPIFMSLTEDFQEKRSRIVRPVKSFFG